LRTEGVGRRDAEFGKKEGEKLRRWGVEKVGNKKMRR